MVVSWVIRRWLPVYTNVGNDYITLSFQSDVTSHSISIPFKTLSLTTIKVSGSLSGFTSTVYRCHQRYSWCSAFRNFFLRFAFFDSAEALFSRDLFDITRHTTVTLSFSCPYSSLWMKVLPLSSGPFILIQAYVLQHLESGINIPAILCGLISLTSGFVSFLLLLCHSIKSRQSQLSSTANRRLCSNK